MVWYIAFLNTQIVEHLKQSFQNLKVKFSFSCNTSGKITLFLLRGKVHLSNKIFCTGYKHFMHIFVYLKKVSNPECLQRWRKPNPNI